MKKLVLLIGSFVSILVLLVGIINLANSEKALKSTTFYEWVSPDGVHYWYKMESNGYSWFAPRYDNNGNLVIDKQN